ncbi:hypothetical protein MPSEU_000823700 [Mayamaea pseudoterrestris]|nr:hypothetical protein MPSEU_000823700 [Mayamaea pseudoterrestris]
MTTRLHDFLPLPSSRSIIIVLLVLQCCSFIQFANASSVAGTETLIGIVGSDFILLGADSSVSQSIVLTSSSVDKISILAQAPHIMDNDKQRRMHRQQCIAAATAGDAADADRLVGLLTAAATIAEYQNGVGTDVHYVECGNIEASADETHQSSHSLASTSPIPASGLSVEQVARLAQYQVSSRLRTSTPLRVCMLVGGMQKHSERRLPSSILVPSTLLPFASSQRDVVGADSSSEGKTETEHDNSLTATTSIPNSCLQPRLYWLDEYGSMQSLLYGAHGHGSHFCMSILDRNYKANMTKEQALKLMRECFTQLRTRYVINAPQPPCIKCIDARGCVRLME